MANENKSKPVPVNDRVKKLRAARREAGLVKVELWVHKTRKSEAKEVENKLQKPRK